MMNVVSLPLVHVYSRPYTINVQDKCMKMVITTSFSKKKKKSKLVVGKYLWRYLNNIRFCLMHSSNSFSFFASYTTINSQFNTSSSNFQSFYIRVPSKTCRCRKMFAIRSQESSLNLQRPLCITIKTRLIFWNFLFKVQII